MSRRRQRDQGTTQSPPSSSVAGKHTGRSVAAPGAKSSSTAPLGAAQATPRLPAIDALRGVALLLMFAYHFAFDLRYYRITASDFEHDPRWLGFRALIVSCFMLLVGISLVLADRAGASSRHFWRRCALITSCALLVSAGSYILFPASFIYFGILHCIVVASILALPLLRRPRLALACGVAVIVGGVTLSATLFDRPWLSWIGFVTTKPLTEDYVPLAPWAGIAFVGIALAHALARVDFRPLAAFNAAPRWLTWLGRHSLLLYMVHQPLLLGLLWLILWR